MDITIELKRSFGRLPQREPFILTDEPRPRLVFVTDYLLADTIVALKNGDAERTIRLKDIANGFILPAEFCRAGILEVTLTLVGNGVPVKKWNVEPIVLRELDEGLLAHPEVEDTLRRVSAIEKQLSALWVLSEKTAERLELMNNTLTGIDEIVNDPLE